ncbi:MAG TPA: ABC transporter permease, partial [Terriglobia bacterium]|nr:ABC transporter permease [Terriglobia bacterium]
MDYLFRRQRVEHEMDEEFQTHLALRVADLERQGISSDEAGRQARIEFGGYQNYKEECRETLGTRLLQELWQDIRYGLRQLRRNPGFTAVAVITLALGIGANTAIFSVVDGVLIHSLPFKDPDRLVVLYQRVPHFGINSFTTPDFLAWKQQTSMPIAAAGEESFNIGEGDRTEHVLAEMVSANFFSLLGVKPKTGRTFLPEEHRPDSRKVVILGYGLWQRDFSGDRGVLGKMMKLNGQPYTIIGVLPRNLRDGLGSAAELWVPFESDFAFTATRHSYSVHWLEVIGRLRKGMTLASARAAVTALGGSLGKEYPQTDARLG